MTIALTLIVVGLMVFLAHALEDLFTRTRVPEVLFLLALGLLLGPAFHLVQPEQLGAVGPIFTTATLVIILFEGGLGLNVKELAHGLKGALLLTLLNFLATMAIAGFAAKILLGLNGMSAAILGAILGGTSSAVVIPMVKGLRISEACRTALSMESALSDVLVIVVSLGLMGAQHLGTVNVGHMVGGMLASFLLAGFIGALGGLSWSLALRRIHGLQNSIFTTPAFVCVVFGVVEWMGYSGAIAALAMGITLGNLEHLPPSLLKHGAMEWTHLNPTELAVFSELVFLLKTFFFVYIGVSIRVSGWADLAVGLGLSLLLLAARIPVVHASLHPDRSTGTDALAATVLIPKGLAAAVVASVPIQMGLPSGETVRDTTFAVVLASILLASILVFLLERNRLAALHRVLFRRFPSSLDG